MTDSSLEPNGPSKPSEKTGVLFIHGSEEFGADAAVHADLMRHLDRKRFEVHVACPAPEGSRESLPLKIFRSIPGLRVRPTHFLRRPEGAGLLGAAAELRGVPQDLADLRRYVRANRIRIVHTTDRPRNAAYAVVLGRLTGAKSVVHVHVKWSNAYTRAARWSVQSADAVFSISRFVTGTIVEMGRSASDVHTVLNAIDLSRWDPSIDGTPLRDELGIPRDAPLLASVSRLFQWKGQRELLRAFARVRERHPGLKLMIVGADASGFANTYTRELKELALQFGLAQDVYFTGPRSDVPQVMAACDVFVLPSFEEPFGLVFAEAMAMAKPVVGLNNGGTPEVVEHGLSGLLSDPADAVGLVNNISTLVSDPALRARLGQYGRRRVEEYFNAPRLARDVEAAYACVLGAEPTS